MTCLWGGRRVFYRQSVSVFVCHPLHSWLCIPQIGFSLVCAEVFVQFPQKIIVFIISAVGQSQHSFLYIPDKLYIRSDQHEPSRTHSLDIYSHEISFKRDICMGSTKCWKFIIIIIHTQSKPQTSISSNEKVLNILTFPAGLQVKTQMVILGSVGTFFLGYSLSSS